ncbi:hypothetical protein [Streptomyces sp. NPDC054783]
MPEAKRSGVVGDRDVDHDEARLADVRPIDRFHVRHYAWMSGRVPAIRRLHPTEQRPGMRVMGRVPAALNELRDEWEKDTCGRTSTNA